MRDPFVTSMGVVRAVSAAIETTGALLILRAAHVEEALQINALLGLAGPIVLIVVTTLGVIGMAGRIHPAKILLIFIGVYLILYGSR